MPTARPVRIGQISGEAGRIVIKVPAQKRKLSFSRLLTILLGALPMLLWLPVLFLWVTMSSFGIMMALEERSLEGVVTLLLYWLWGLLGLWGAYALWAAALGPNPVGRSTALGLGAGILAMVLLLYLLNGDPSANPGKAAYSSTGAVFFAYLPILVALWHLWQYLEAEGSFRRHRS
jgi:hypothetical protein